MGRAIVRQPQAFLMDEPLSNLDAKLRVQMRAEIARIQRDLGVTTIYVTHDQTEAMTLGDRVAVMRLGQLQQVASPQQLYDAPDNLFVAGFIGSPAMNMMEARIEGGAGETWLALGSQRLRLADTLLTDQPDLSRYRDRTIVAGIRPEDMDDAALVPDFPTDRRLRSTAGLVEAMGSDVFVHFVIDAPRVVTEATKELAADVGAEAIEQLERQAASAESEVTARFSPRSTAKEGDTIEVAVDTSRFHFFDPESGLAVAKGAFS
jgi:multiple sugar transport system ATP-binding protein